MAQASSEPAAGSPAAVSVRLPEDVDLHARPAADFVRAAMGFAASVQVAAGGREVLAWGAWRTAWMSGYFYNDGRVHEVSGFPEVVTRLQQGGPVLVLCGPGERRRLGEMSGLSMRVLAEGPKQNALVRLERR